MYFASPFSPPSAYLDRNPFLGLRTLGESIYNCVIHSGIDLSQAIEPSAAADQIGAYLVGAKRALKQMIEAEVPKVTYCQDGGTRWYPFDNSGGIGCIQLDTDGCLSLRNFAPR